MGKKADGVRQVAGQGFLTREQECGRCGDPYPPEDMADATTCKGCERKERFAAFAKECGLTRFPDPSGERYVYRADDLSCEGKKGECVDFMDELWGALVKALVAGEARKILMPGGE